MARVCSFRKFISSREVKASSVSATFLRGTAEVTFRYKTRASFSLLFYVSSLFPAQLRLHTQYLEPSDVVRNVVCSRHSSQISRRQDPRYAGRIMESPCRRNVVRTATKREPNFRLCSLAHTPAESRRHINIIN